MGGRRLQHRFTILKKVTNRNNSKQLKAATTKTIVNWLSLWDNLVVANPINRVS